MPDLLSNGQYPQNRVTEAIYLYAEQEAQLQISNPHALRSDPHSIALKLDYYRDVFAAHRKKPNPQEKAALSYLYREISKMHAQLHPSLFNKIIYSPLIERARSFVSGNNILYRQYGETIRNIKKEVVKEHNLAILSEHMKKSGFKFEIDDTLKRMIEQDLPQFHIRYADMQHRNADFVLHFRKLPESEVYFFEKFDATARPDLEALLNNDYRSVRQTFSPHGELSFTAREAHSLVHGKSVCKIIGGKETWLLLDGSGILQPNAFRQLSFDLQKVLKKLPIKQLDNPAQYKAISDALKTGISKEVTISVNGKDSKYLISAAPTRKTIDILDKDNKLVELGKIQGGHIPELTKKLASRVNQQDDVIELFPQGNRKKR